MFCISIINEQFSKIDLKISITLFHVPVLADLLFSCPTSTACKLGLIFSDSGAVIHCIKMSWLFGLRQPGAPEIPMPPPPSGAGSGGSGDDGKPGDENQPAPIGRKSEAYRFDSSALERAAQAAKELERSSECIFQGTLLESWRVSCSPYIA